jgi:hypothetical protein
MEQYCYAVSFTILFICIRNHIKYISQLLGVLMKNFLVLYLIIWGLWLNSGISQTVSTYASGVFGAVGIEIDGRGWIWVAQSGTGNNDSRISIVTAENQVYPFITGLPSELLPDGEIAGSEHVFFSPERKLLIMQGGPGTDSLSQSILVVDTTGFIPGTSSPLGLSAIETVYNVGDFVYSNIDTVSNPYCLAFGPNNDMYIVDAAANAVIRRENATGNFSLFATFPDIPNNTGIGPPFVNVVPTGIVYRDNSFFVSSLTGFPFSNNAATVYKVDAAGNVFNYLTGLTTIVDLTTDPNDSLVILEHAAFQLPPFMPNSGVVLGINNGSSDTIVSGLNRPTSIRFKSTNELFVSTLTDGKILRVVKDGIPSDGLQLWLKADAGVIINNSTVSRWIDQSGNGNDLVEYNTSRQPIIVNNELNGLPVIRFDGDNDRLGFTGSKSMNKVSLFMVFKNKSGVPGPSNYPGFVLVSGPGSSFTPGEHFIVKMRGFNNTDDIINIAVAGDATNLIQATSPNIAKYDEWRNINIISDSTIFNTTVRWNGNDASMVTVGSDVLISAKLGDSTGSGGGLGSTDNFPGLGTVRAKCDIAELIVYDKVLSYTERLAIENYLNQKYNITINGINDSQDLNMPERFALSQNYPNPFNPTTIISFSIPSSEFITLKVFDVLGKKVSTLVNEEKPAGSYEVSFSAFQLSSGIYFYELQAGSFVETKKMILLR